MHGVYDRESTQRARAALEDPLVTLGLHGGGIAEEDDDTQTLLLSVGEARHLAALLIYLADEADQLNRPLTGRRKRHG
jgi:hypothetical protein